MRGKVFAWIALWTGLILLVPMVAMQFTQAVAWGKADFFVAGALLFGTASTCVLVLRKVPRSYRIFTCIPFAAALAYVWVELAVGVFTHFGS